MNRYFSSKRKLHYRLIRQACGDRMKCVDFYSMLCHLIGSADVEWHKHAETELHRNWKQIWFCLQMNWNTNGPVSHSLHSPATCANLTEWNSKFNTSFSPPFVTAHLCSYAKRHNRTRIEMRWKMEFVVRMNGISPNTHQLTLAMQQSLAKHSVRHASSTSLAHTQTHGANAHLLIACRIEPCECERTA